MCLVVPVLGLRKLHGLREAVPGIALACMGAALPATRIMGFSELVVWSLCLEDPSGCFVGAGQLRPVGSVPGDASRYTSF